MKKSSKVTLIIVLIGISVLVLASVLMGLSSNRMTEEEMEKATKYKLAYVYIEEQLELKDLPEIKTINFVTKNPSDRFRLKLSYQNFDHLDMKEDSENLSNIYKSLVGFSVQIYDKANNHLIYSYEITESNLPSVSTASPSLFLGSGIQVTGMREYSIIVKIPAKKDTQDQYLKPTFVAGVVDHPYL